MKINKRIEIAKVGNWNGIDLTADMLQQMHNNFQKVPIRPGHTAISKGQKTDGALLQSYYENGILSGDMELQGQLADDYQNNKYIAWSMDNNKYDNGWNITALALLGAEKPAIKGLKEIQFSEDNQTLNITFQEVSKMELTKEEITEAVKLAFAEKMADTDKDKEIEMLKAEIAELKMKLGENESKIAEFAEKEAQKAEQIKADHNAKVEARKTEIMLFSEPEAIQFETLFKDKPESAIFMERYSVKDTRVTEPKQTALQFSEDDKKQAKTESVTEAQLRLKNKKKGL
jgi:hypothetical protein